MRWKNERSITHSNGSSGLVRVVWTNASSATPVDAATSARFRPEGYRSLALLSFGS